MNKSKLTALFIGLCLFFSCIFLTPGVALSAPSVPEQPSIESNNQSQDDSTQVTQPLAAQQFLSGIAVNWKQIPYAQALEHGRKLRDMGVRLVRIEFTDWVNRKSHIEDEVKAARDAGLIVYAEIGANTVFLPGIDPDGTYRTRQRYWHQNFTDAGNAYAWNFANTAGEIAAYFKNKGLPIAYYEIWNEPNAAPRLTNGKSDWNGACGAAVSGYDYGVDNGQGATAICPRQLGVLTTNAYMKIKEANPNVRIVAGNLLTHGDGAWVAKQYWEQVEASPAAAWHKTNKGRLPWDIVAIHPYDFPLFDQARNQIPSMRALMQQFGEQSPIAVSEIGWSTQAGQIGGRFADEATQAAHLKNTFQAAQQQGLEFLVWYNYLDEGNHQFGIRNLDRNPSWKPSATAYCQVASAPNCPSNSATRNLSLNASARTKDGKGAAFVRYAFDGSPNTGWNSGNFPQQ